MSGASKPTIERVGLVLVHGIGEQKRFEHIDSQGRQIIRALKTAYPDQTVEIEAPDTATFHAEQATWRAGGEGSVQVLIGHPKAPKCRIHIHEVWWTDVNERQSIPKQVRFWLWGLSVWVYPRLDRKMPTFINMQILKPSSSLQFWKRLRLFGVGCVFTVGALPLGLGLSLLQRLLGLRGIPLLPTVANYISGVKLFVQPRRNDAGIIPGNADFLDSLDEPPRVSIRRRMIRAIADVAAQRYDRWYIIAHSQGTVAALNGLMERAEAWPGYFTETEWTTLRGKGFVSPQALGATPPVLPRPPLWNVNCEQVDRTKVFEKFCGLITLGSPIEKFATIWPTRVPISNELVMPKNAFWINIYDPLDSVSGRMTSFKGQNPLCCPIPQDVGYRSSCLLLVGHTRYLARCGGGHLADGIATMLAVGDKAGLTKPIGYFCPGKAVDRWRHVSARLQWILLYLFLSCLAGLTLHWAWRWARMTASAVWDVWRACPSFRYLCLYAGRETAIGIIVSVMVTLICGCLARLMR